MVPERLTALFRIDHVTKLIYSEPVTESVIEVRMAPPSDEDQTVLGYRLEIKPVVAVTGYRDGFGNRVDLFSIGAPHREVVIRATSFVRVHRPQGRILMADAPGAVEEPVALDALEFLHPSSLVDNSADLDAFVGQMPAPTGPLVESLETVMSAVRERLKYEKRITTAWTPLSEALVLGKGVCQDIAHLFVGTCRRLGLPARYVSGYVHQPGEIATHAWCQVWGGTSAGWVDVDPTQGKWVATDHIVTAVGRDFADVPPNRGVWKGAAQETVEASVQVQAIDRVPADWVDMGSQRRPRSAFVQVQAPGRGNGLHHQSSGRNRLRQQQSQQQQSMDVTGTRTRCGT